MDTLRKKIFIILNLSFIYLSIFSNGGPIDESWFYRANHIQLINKANIKVLSEDLFIKINGKYTIVTVEYKIRNNGEKQMIKYGFAVDLIEDGFNIDIEANDYEIVKYFHFYDNKNEIIDTSVIYEKNIEQVNIEHPVYFVNHESISRIWYIADLNFGKDEIKTLRVTYKIANNHSDHISGFGFIPTFSERIFSYYFKPTSKFGNGIIDKFSLKIDISELIEAKTKYQILGISDHTISDGIVSFNQTKFDPEKAERLLIKYDQKEMLLSNLIKNQLLSKEEIIDIKSSNNHNPIYLIDNNPKTAWKGVKGDWIEITFRADTTVSSLYDFAICAIQALSGDYSNIDNFNQSAKIKTIKIFINDSIKYRPINGEFGDSVNISFPLYPFSDSPFIEGYSNSLAEGESLYRFYSEFFTNTKRKYSVIKKIKILVTDVYLGIDNQNEFSISELYFIKRKKNKDNQVTQ